MRKRKIRKPAEAKPNAKLLRKMSATRMAKLLSVGGKRVEPAAIRAHIKAGVPTDKRGQIRLADYAAWLVAEVANPNQAP